MKTWLPLEVETGRVVSIGSCLEESFVRVVSCFGRYIIVKVKGNHGITYVLVYSNHHQVFHFTNCDTFYFHAIVGSFCSSLFNI